MKYFKCENCGSELTKNADNTYTCSYCRRTYYDDSLEKAYDRVYQNLRGTVQGVVTEELLKQKIEQIANCRQALYKERNEQFVDNTEIERWAGEILKLSPKDAQANFYFLAAKKRWSELNKFMQKLNAREVSYLVEGFVDYLTNGQFVEKCVLCLNDLIDRAFDADSKEYAACHKKIVAADERERSGIFDVSLPRDVFVAYSSKDKEKAYELVEYLEKNGFSCFIAMRNLAKGVDAALKYNERLKTAMDSCRVFLLVSSTNSRARDCDAYRVEMQYVRDCDCKKANDFALANARYEEYLEKNRNRCKPRLEYLIEEYGSSPYERNVKKFFGGLTWCRSLESVSDAVFELIENAELGETAEERLARERADFEAQKAEMEKAKLQAELELAKKEAELEKLKKKKQAEAKEKKQESESSANTPIANNAPIGNIDDLYKAFKQRERQEEEEKKRKAEEAERKCKEEAERKRKEEEERKRQIEIERQRKAEEERKRQEEIRKQVEAQEKIKRDFQIEKGVLIKYNGSDEEVVIPKNVTSIGDSAFENCGRLTLVKIPDGVRSIGSSAFNSCSRLIGVEIPKGVTSIGNMAFANCNNLANVTIPDSVTSIGNGAFVNCGSLTSITISDNVTEIGINAFACNCSLMSITVGENNKAYKSIDGNLYSKDGKTLIQYATGNTATSFTIPDGVTSIGNHAFAYGHSLTSITIPDSVKNIGLQAFTNCSGLTSITIPDSVTCIALQTFENCGGLTSVVIGASVEKICDNAFRHCRGLTSIQIGSRVKSIGSSAFEGCIRLTSIVIPDSVETVGKDAFKGCSSLKKVEVIKTTKITGAFENIKIVSYRETEEEKIKREFQIKNGKLIKYRGAGGDVVIPNLVTSIGYEAFHNCKSLTSIVIPDSVTSIEQYAFSSCDNLTSVTIPNSLISIVDCAFVSCYNLTSVHISDIKAWCNIKFGGEHANPLRFAENLYLNNELVTKLVVPNTVREIKAYAFYGCKSLTSVVIPDSVTSIAERAFWFCESLTSVEIPDSVTSIAERAFSFCKSLTSVEIPESVTTIGDWSFSNCTSLTSVEIPDSVTSIAKYAFYNCTNLKKIFIPKTVLDVAHAVFENCPNLTIYAETAKKPNSWVQPMLGVFGKENWNPDKRPVKWGSTKADFDKA